MIPSGGIPSGHAQIAPQGRQGLCVVGHHLGTEQLAPLLVAPVVLVGHYGVGVLMLEQLAVALARRAHIVRHVERRHTYLYQRLRQRRGTTVAVVLPVGQQEQRGFGAVQRVGGPYLIVQRLTMVIHAHHMRDVARQVLVEEHQRGIIRVVLIISLVLPQSHHRKQNQYQ